MSLHKLDRAKDKNFWSVRVSRVIRLIVHKTAASLLLCFVGHHDKAYQWLRQQLAQGIAPHEIAVFVRSDEELERACAATAHAGSESRVLDERMAPEIGAISVCTMHLAKGLEFRSVAVMACDDEVIPSQARIESIADNADLQEGI